MRMLARAFVAVFGTGLTLIVAQYILVVGPDGIGPGIAVTLSIVSAFLWPIAMDLTWWLALVLLVLTLRQR